MGTDAGEESRHELPRGTNNVKDKQRRQSFCYCFIPLELGSHLPVLSGE